MIVWLIVPLALLVWNALYCLRRSIDDFRHGRTKAGVSGALAFGGAFSALGVSLFVVLLSLYWH